MGNADRQSLICCCCDKMFVGWQYHQRDKGFGVCRDCGDEYGYNTEGNRPSPEYIREITKRLFSE